MSIKSISYWWEGRKGLCITKASISHLIKYTIKDIVRNLHGLRMEDVGTHSNRSACIMAVYLTSFKVYIIMIIERCYSNAFLFFI